MQHYEYKKPLARNWNRLYSTGQSVDPPVAPELRPVVLYRVLGCTWRRLPPWWAQALLQSSPELWGSTLGGTVSEVEDCGAEHWLEHAFGQKRKGEGVKSVHSSTQSSFGCFLSTALPSSAPVTRSTHSSKWCLEGAHCLDSRHSVYIC